MKIVVLSITPYKEKDGIVNAASESGCFSFNARGIMSSSAKAVSLNNPMTIADVDFADQSKSKNLVLKTSDVIFTPMEFMGDSTRMTLTMIVSELINKCLEADEKTTAYKTLLDVLLRLKKNVHVYSSILYLVFYIFKVSGYELDVNGCHICGSKKDIVAFDFENGGFICKNCLSEFDNLDLSGEELLTIRKLYKADSVLDVSFDLDKKTFLDIFKKALVFIQDNYGLKIKNSEILFD